jgi:hypothetical protein
MKCKNIFSVLSNLSVFESWSEAVVGHGIEVLKVEELRIVKVDVLRANIARICAVGLMSFRFQVPCSSLTLIGMHRTFQERFWWEHHRANLFPAPHRQGTLSLRGRCAESIIEPNIHTDHESQAPARKMLHISRRLRRAKHLQTPRSLNWLLPISFAAMEITDKIYRGLALNYHAELEHWGTNMRNTRELLENVISRQKKEEWRVRVKGVMVGFDVVVII